MKTVVVLQSNYIPWKGYFDLIHDADVFVFYDDVQYTKNDWRNRNKLKSASGADWLTIPVGSNVDRLICEVEIANISWQIKHWRTIEQNYTKSPYFSLYRDILENVYTGRQWSNLSELNQFLIRTIAIDILGIRTVFQNSSDFALVGKKMERLLDLIIKLEGERYISGPAARQYIEPDGFVEARVQLDWKDYNGYPEYPQRFPPFEHGVSILDLLFNVGPDAGWYIWGWRDTKKCLFR